MYRTDASSSAGATSPLASTTIARRSPAERDAQIEILFCGVCHSGLLETQEMLDFCGQHNIVSDVEVIPIQKINEAYDRMMKSDVKYRFSIDMASLKSEEGRGVWR